MASLVHSSTDLAYKSSMLRCCEINLYNKSTSNDSDWATAARWAMAPPHASQPTSDWVNAVRQAKALPRASRSTDAWAHVCCHEDGDATHHQTLRGGGRCCPTSGPADGRSRH